MAKSLVLAFVLAFMLTWLALASGSGCEKRREPPARKPQIVLVHSFRSGAFSWYQEKYALDSAGYNTTAIDLSACGLDMTHVSKVLTFEDYNRPLDRFMAALPPHEKVVLVGGGAGGVSVTKAIHDHPRKILAAVYVSATMLRDGFLTCAHLEMGLPDFTSHKCHASCPILPHPTCFDQAEDGWTELPFKDRSTTYVLSKSLSRAGPMRALATANFTETSRKRRIDRVPRVYVKTLLDRLLLPWQQDRMIQQWPPCEMHELFYGHGVAGNEHLLTALVMNATFFA